MAGVALFLPFRRTEQVPRRGCQCREPRGCSDGSTPQPREPTARSDEGDPRRAEGGRKHFDGVIAAETRIVSRGSGQAGKRIDETTELE
jgi:hypothetical protein